MFQLLQYLYPKRCPVCNRVLKDKTQDICAECKKHVVFVKEPACFSCGKPLDDEETEYCSDCRKHPKAFLRGAALCVYNQYTRHSLSAIKYHNCRDYAAYYMKEVKKKKLEWLRDCHADAVIPVPLHKRKLRQRGFNQAELFAKEIGEMLGKPVVTDLLVRTVYTTPQKKLDPGERSRNLSQVFSLKRPLRPNGIPEAVLLIDDIYTTGATVNNCTKILLSGGVKKVYVFCIAIGMGD